MDRPVIFFAFADDKSNHLPNLKEESKQLYRALQAMHDKGFIEIYRDEAVNIEGLFDDFQRFRERLAIFHFSGHAGSTRLDFEAGAAHSEGLAQLFAEQKDWLQLVFLNGCSTYEQVKKLHELGIRAVIATSVQIGDRQAADFSVTFYKALSNHFTLEQAFKRACSFIKTKYGDAEEGIISYRGMDLEEPEDKMTLPWGLYIKTDAAETGNWKLPAIRVEPPRKVADGYKVNEGMLEILAAMEEMVPDIFISNPRLRERKAPVTIRENFPWPMSAQIRMLYANTPSMNEHALPRFKQLVEAYNATSKFLAFTLLSQLWDEIYSKRELNREELAVLTLPDGENYQSFDFLFLLKKCFQLLSENNIVPFMKDIKGSVERLEKGGDSYESYRYIESKRADLLMGIVDENEAGKYSRECDSILTELLTRASFLAKFRLLTIKDISVFAPKRLASEFIHQFAELNTTSREDIFEEDLSMNNFANSHSILLTPRFDGTTLPNTLNLSPFIIDKSTFDGAQAPAIFMFSHTAGEKLFYQSVDLDINAPHNEADFLEIDKHDKEFNMVWEQFNSFLKDMEA